MRLPARKHLSTPPKASAAVIKPDPLPKTTPLPKPSLKPLTTLIVKFHARSRQEAIERYYPDITLGGLFIRTSVDPRLSPGTKVTFRFLLENGSSYEAQGLIAWVQQTPFLRGLGIKFLHLSIASEQFFGDMLNRRQAEIVNGASQDQNGMETTIGEFEFSDAPTWRKQSSALLP